MREFTYENWQAALTKVFERAAFDPAYRELCLIDPRAAVREVSDIELPGHFEFEFVSHRRDIFYSLLLPPLVTKDEPMVAERDIIIWALSTHPTMGYHPPPTPPPQKPPPSEGR